MGGVCRSTFFSQFYAQHECSHRGRITKDPGLEGKIGTWEPGARGLHRSTRIRLWGLGLGLQSGGPPPGTPGDMTVDYGSGEPGGRRSAPIRLRGLGLGLQFRWRVIIPAGGGAAPPGGPQSSAIPPGVPEHVPLFHSATRL